MAVLHIPHASTAIPASELEQFTVTADGLHAELLVMTDWFTDELFFLPDDLGQAVRFPVSRLVVDPERFVDNDAEPMAQRGMGVIYERTSTGQMLRASPDAMTRQRMIDTYYSPHHKLLEDAVVHDLERDDFALVIDCHSFSSRPLPHEFDQSSVRPDICIGADDFHTPPELIAAAETYCRDRGWSMAVNRPFAGALVPMRFYQADARVQAVMIEVNRSLYMDEKSGVRLSSFAATATSVQALLRTVAAQAMKKA